jgi:hypothetical protein
MQVGTQQQHIHLSLPLLSVPHMICVNLVDEGIIIIIIIIVMSLVVSDDRLCHHHLSHAPINNPHEKNFHHHQLLDCLSIVNCVCVCVCVCM